MANSNKEISDACAKVLETSKKVARWEKIVAECSEAVSKYDEMVKETQETLQDEWKTLEKMMKLSTEESTSNAKRILKKCSDYIIAVKERDNAVRNLDWAEMSLKNAELEKSTRRNNV